MAGSRAVIKRAPTKAARYDRLRLSFANGLESVVITAASDFQSSYFDVPINAESGPWAYVTDSSHEPLGTVLIVHPELNYPHIKVSLTGLRTFGSSGDWNKIISDTVIPVNFTATADQHSMLANTPTHWVLDYELKADWYSDRTNGFSHGAADFDLGNNTITSLTIENFSTQSQPHGAINFYDYLEFRDLPLTSAGETLTVELTGKEIQNHLKASVLRRPIIFNHDGNVNPSFLFKGVTDTTHLKIQFSREFIP